MAEERHLVFAIERWNRAILPLLISRLPQPVLPAPILPADNRIERVYELLKLGLAPRAIIPEVRYMYGLSSGVRSRDRRYLLMRLLVINGLDPGSMEDEADTLLHSLCRGYTPSEDIGLLFDVGVNIHGAYIVNLRNASGDTPLHCYLACPREALTGRANPSAVSRCGCFPSRRFRPHGAAVIEVAE